MILQFLNTNAYLAEMPHTCICARFGVCPWTCRRDSCLDETETNINPSHLVVGICRWSPMNVGRLSSSSHRATANRTCCTCYTSRGLSMKLILLMNTRDYEQSKHI